MSYREVSVVEVREVLRGWMAGAGLRTVAQRAGVDRGTGAHLVINWMGEHEISRFSRMEAPYMPWISDHAESAGDSRTRHQQCCLPPL